MRFWIIGFVLAGCTQGAGDHEVAVHVNADARVCVGDHCGDALVWEPFRLALAEGEYTVTAHAREVLERQEVGLEVGLWGPNTAWVNFAHGEFNFAKVEFITPELVTVFANDVSIGMAFQDRPLVYGFTPRSYTFCAITLDETRRDCATVDLADGAELLVLFSPRNERPRP